MSRSLLNKTSELKDVNPVAGSSVSAADYISTLSLQVGGAGAQTQTLTYSSMTNGDSVTVTIGPDAGDTKTLTITLDATTGASDTAAGDAIADEINAATKISNLVKATNAAGIVTLTGRQKGASATFFATSTVTGSGSVSVAAAVDPTDATAIVPGCMCELSTATRVQGTADIGSAIGTGTYTAQITTLTFSGATADETVNVNVRADQDGSGVKDYAVSMVTTNNNDHNAAGLKVALESVLESSLFTVTVASAVVTITSDVAGLSFEVSESISDASATGAVTNTLTVATSTANAIPSGAGVALFSQTVEQNASGVLEFGTGSELSSMQEGRIHVLLDSGVTVANGDPVFVRTTATGSEQLGAFRNAADAADCLPISAFGFSATFSGANFTDMNGENVAPLSISRA